MRLPLKQGLKQAIMPDNLRRSNLLLFPLKYLIASFLFFLIYSQVIFAQETGHIKNPELIAVPITEGEIIVDGRLDEPIWAEARPVGGLVQRNPDTGKPASQETQVRVVYGKEALYFGVILNDTNPDEILASVMRRDADQRRDDSFSIIIDTYHDHRNGFFFSTNPVGAMEDILIFDEGRNTSHDWNGIWEAAATIVETGWIAEVRIPFKTLRFDSDRLETWGIQFRRIIRRRNEDSFWSFVPRDANVFRLSMEGHLKGLKEIRPGWHLDMTPYLLSGIERLPSSDSPDREGVLNAGIDLRYGIATNLIADLTINTDFAQVEVDEQQVNITRFPIFFPEKRDFFLEGKGYFDFGISGKLQPFFSRRIGLVSGGEIPIIGGTKVSGKVGRYSLGLLSVETDKEGDEPETNYTVLRIKQDILERSDMGIIAINKDAIGEDRFNRTFGADLNLSLFRNLNINSFLIFTASSDIGDNDLAAYLKTSWSSELWGFSISRLDVGDNFNPEVGFVQRTGIEENRGSIELTPRPKDSSIREYDISTSINYTTDQQREPLVREIELSFASLMHSGDHFGISLTNDFERLKEDFEIRSGIVIPTGEYDFNSIFIFAASDTSRIISGGISYEIGGFFNGDKKSYDLSLRYNPIRYLNLSTSYERNEIDLPAGSFNINLINARVDLNFSTKASLNTLGQWNDDTDEFLLNIRFNYEYRPGSYIYLVYNQRLDTANDIYDYSIMLKIKYLFRI